MAKILPCPFCGSNDIKEGVYYKYNAPGKIANAVRCADCGARAPLTSWQKRSTPAAIGETLIDEKALVGKPDCPSCGGTDTRTSGCAR